MKRAVRPDAVVALILIAVLLAFVAIAAMAALPTAGLDGSNYECGYNITTGPRAKRLPDAQKHRPPTVPVGSRRSTGGRGSTSPPPQEVEGCRPPCPLEGSGVLLAVQGVGEGDGRRRSACLG